MAVFSIRRFAIKQLMKAGDDGIMKMPSDMKADFAEAMLTKQLIDAGIDPRTIKNEQQMINVLDAIDNAKKAEKTTETTKKVTSNVVDLKGKKLDTSKPIIGGTQEGGLDNIFNEMYSDFQKDKLKFMRGDDKPPPGSRGGKDDIAAPVQSAEETLKNMTEAELKEKFMRENKEAVARIKNKKLIDDAIDNVSIGFSGDRRTDAELVAAEIAERRGLNIDDLDTRQRASIYGEAYEALTNFLRKDKADGGRIGLRIGSGEGKDVSGREYSAPSAAAKSVKTSPSRDDGPSGGGSNVTAPVKTITPKTKSTLKNLYNTGQELNYLKNLMIGNFPGIGKQLLFDLGKRKFLGDQSMLDQEGIINGLPENQFAELTPKQQKFIDQKKFGLQENLLDAKDVFETINNPDLGIFDKGTFGFGAQEPTTPKEFNDYLKSIGVVQQVKDGGRIGLKDGMNRRTFMKVMAGLASIPILGKFFKGAKVASKAAPVAMESATRSEAPTYFLKLVDKITKQGRPTTSTEDIMETYIYTGKNGDSYELVNDLKTGDIRITKDKMGVGTYGDKTFDTINDRTVMEYKAPKEDMDVETGRGTREAPEYEEYKVEFDADGTEAGAEAIEETVQKEIIEESAEEAPSIKKADGGRVGLLSGGGILRTILTNLAKDKGISPSEYLRLTNYKALPNEAKRIMSKEEFLRLKSDMTEKRIELMDTVKNMITTRQGFETQKENLRKSMNMASEGYGDKAVEMMFSEKLFPSPVPAGSSQKDVMMMEQLIKNLKNKRQTIKCIRWCCLHAGRIVWIFIKKF